MSVSPHILLVDDEVRFAESLQLILLANNYSSVIAPNGSRALELVEEQAFDLILLDVELPDISGVQIVSHIKSLFPLIPVIMMTGNATVETAVTAIKNGAYDFLKKPIDHNTLTVTIDKAINHSQLEKELKASEQEKLVLQKQLAKASKMEALGLMAGSVAHDLNNILSGIVSFPEVILMEMDPKNKHREAILGMQEAGKRAASVVSDLVSIARGTTTSKAVKNPNSIIESHFSSLEHLECAARFPRITMCKELRGDLLNINCSEIHIKKMLMNLLGNAMEALDDKGSITISTENIHLTEPLVVYETIAAGDYVKISVSDNGEGISSTDIEHIFEPFYSKKVMGRSGTGLGLAIVWSRIHDHDGYINVTSGPEGTTFELFIPSTFEAEFAPNPAISLNALKGAGEVVLVVDDQRTQCIIASNLLKNLGYAPLQAHNGRDAVAICKKTSVDIVLLDMVLDQEMNGREAYEQMLEANLEQRAIVVSGSAENKEVDKMKSLGASHFVKKPYTVDQLALAVKQSLRNIPGHF